MATKIATSEDIRVYLRDYLDATIAGDDVVIERYRKPTAVLVNFERYHRLLEVERIAEAKRQFAEMDAGNVVTIEPLQAPA